MIGEKMQTALSFSEHSERCLRDHVHKSLQKYFEQLGETSITDLYGMVLSVVEEPLFRKVMEYTKSNQSKAAILLGLSRGTLRKKLTQYGMLTRSVEVQTEGEKPAEN